MNVKKSISAESERSWLSWVSQALDDADGNGSVDIDDVVYLINYIFSGGPAPNPVCVGDTDSSGDVDIDDVVFLINYIFGGGLPPGDDCCDGKAFGKVVVGEAELSISTTSDEQVNTVSYSIAADQEVQAIQLDFEVHSEVRSVKVESLTDGIQEFRGISDGIFKPECLQHPWRGNENTH